MAKDLTFCETELAICVNILREIELDTNTRIDVQGDGTLFVFFMDDCGNQRTVARWGTDNFPGVFAQVEEMRRGKTE